MTGRETRVGSLLPRLDAIIALHDRNVFFGAVLTHIAAGIERGGPEAKSAEEDGYGWGMVDSFLAAMEKDDPDATFSSAVDFVLLPEVSTETHETLNKWLRSNGLVILGLEENTERLGEYFEANDSRVDELSLMLMKNMNIDMTPFDQPGSFVDPMGFTCLQSIYVCLGLKNADSPLSKRLYQHALEKCQNPVVQTALKAELADVNYAYLKDRFEPV